MSLGIVPPPVTTHLLSLILIKYGSNEIDLIDLSMTSLVIIGSGCGICKL